MDQSMLHALALRAADGDRAALDAVCRECRPLVARYVQQKIAPPAMADGVVDIVFDVVRRSIGRYPAHGSPLQHWMLRVARAVVLEYYRFFAC